MAIFSKKLTGGLDNPNANKKGRDERGRFIGRVPGEEYISRKTGKRLPNPNKPQVTPWKEGDRSEGEQDQDKIRGLMDDGLLD